MTNFFLPEDFARAERSFAKTMQGTVGTEDRWRTCVLATNAAMGFAIAPSFVDKGAKLI